MNHLTRHHRLSASLSLLFVGIALSALAACQMPDDTRTQRDVPRTTGPDERMDLTGWWSNGDQLLRLERDGRYLFYETDARHEPPLHRGRWDLRSQDRLTLEPYTELDMDTQSVDILADNGELVLRVPDYPDFRPTSAPQFNHQREQSPRPPFEPEPMSNNTA